MSLLNFVIAASDFDEHESAGVATDAKSILKTLTSADRSGPPYYESKLIIGDEKISFLARQLLAREEWKRLAYALGFLPPEVCIGRCMAMISLILFSCTVAALHRSYKTSSRPNHLIYHSQNRRHR